MGQGDVQLGGGGKGVAGVRCGSARLVGEEGVYAAEGGAQVLGRGGVGREEGGGAVEVLDAVRCLLKHGE